MNNFDQEESLNKKNVKVSGRLRLSGRCVTEKDVVRENSYQSINLWRS